MKIIKRIIFKVMRDSIEWELYMGEIDSELAMLKYKYWDDKINNL